jgi:hypothetical protein
MVDDCGPPFLRVPEPDGQYRSICTTCFLTVATGQSEDGLLDGELRHDCFRVRATSPPDRLP